MRKLTPGGAAPNPLLLPLACSLACSLALFALPLNAQTVASTTPGVPTPVTSAAPIGASEEVLQEKLFSASAKSLTQLIQQQATPVQMDFKRLPDLPADVSTEGVTINGYSQYVDVDGQKVGQLIITGLKKDTKEAALDPNKFTAQFDLDTPELPAEKALDIKGDRADLIEALRKLNAEEEEPAKEEEKEDKPEAAERQTSPVQNEAQNDQAAQYKSPERLQSTPEPEEEIRTTTEGCSVRVDLIGEKAIQQSKVQTFKGGVLSEDGACSDSGDEFPLKKSYDVCKDEVNLDAKIATAQFRWFYVNAQQARFDVSECAPDPAKVYPIVEKHNSCAIDINIENKLATPQSKLIYIGQNSTEQQVRDCAPSVEKPAVALTQVTDSCTIKHNLAGGSSKEMGMWTYTLDGTIFQATPCTETGVEFSHTKVYKYDGGGDVCAPILDLAKKTATPQYRVEITVAGQKQFITECTPDQGGSLAVKSTTETCENPINFEHDIAAGVSYGKERFYYENPGRVYVSECQKSAVTYQHQVETVGWQNHDNLKSAYPLTTVTITPNGSPFEVVKSVVLPGSTLTPYVFDRSGNEVTGVTYEGCDAMKTTADVKVYKRPDGTEYKEPIGTGTPVGPIFACTVTAAPYWKLQSTSNSSGQVSVNFGNCGNKSVTRRTSTGYYKGFRPVSREDGQNFVQESSAIKTASYSATQGGSCSYEEVNQGSESRYRWFFGRGGVPGYPTPTATLYTQSAWDSAEGW